MKEFLITALTLLLGIGPVILPIWAAVHEFGHLPNDKTPRCGEY